MSNKENIKLHENLIKFFKDECNLNILYNVLNRKEVYSLRVLEWFITNYCKKHLVIYQVNGKQFNVYKKYKEVLKSYTKEGFDPFKRIKNNSINIKIVIFNPLTKTDIETTICQMNFFNWVIKNNIHKYVEKHINTIKNEMKEDISSKKTTKKQTKKTTKK